MENKAYINDEELSYTEEVPVWVACWAEGGPVFQFPANLVERRVVKLKEEPETPTVWNFTLGWLDEADRLFPGNSLSDD